MSTSSSSSTPLIAALISTGFISLAPNLILFLFPSYASGEGSGSWVMCLGQSLAAGGLLGEALYPQYTVSNNHQTKIVFRLAIKQICLTLRHRRNLF